MQIAVGLDSDNVIVAAACIIPGEDKQASADIGEMVLEGLTVKIIESKCVTIGKRLDQITYTEKQG